MITPKERGLEAAARTLSEKARKRRGDSVEIFRGFRKIEEHRLRMWHNAGGGGREVARQRSDLVDILIRELLESIIRNVSPNGLPEPLVAAAFGGYGRRELTPCSDIDIMFLHGKPQPTKETQEVIRQTLVALWDIGFKVGHSSRSVSQAIKQANGDLVTKTSMLECRYLTGARDLFNGFKTRFVDECIRGREGPYVAWRLANQAEMREKYGASVFMQEPNVKSGMGGLRDVHNMMWLALVKHSIPTLAKLVENKLLRETERRPLDRGYDFLLRVRTEMQYINSRANDQLTLQLQGKVATRFNYPQRHILRKCEAFMRDYYSHSRDIHLITQAVNERMGVLPAPKTKPIFNFFGGRPRPERFDGFLLRDGQLEPESREIFTEDPYRMIRAFHHAQVRQVPLSPELRDLIRRRLRLVDRTFQYARAARETFLGILSRKGEVGPILREMHNLGFLGRYLPEFGALTCLVQHEFFHRYTADEHTLVCIEKLDGILFATDDKLRGYRALFQKLEDPSMLYLALLLHDTGKAMNQRHHEEASTVFAAKVARRLQLSPSRRKMLIALVDAHYSLSHTAQTRNLDDAATINEFARVIHDRATLDALMLVTLADGMGTSDKNWSDWKESLVWTLYRRTVEHLEGGPTAAENLLRSREEQLGAVRRRLSKDFAEEIEAHFLHMPERYFQNFPGETVADHIRLFRAFFESLRVADTPPIVPVTKWIPRPEQGHSEVWICGWDRVRLLERISGAFLAANVNILSADIFTRGDNLALDIFRVCSTQHHPVTNPKDIARVHARLAESLATEDFDFSPLMQRDALLRSYRISQEAELPTKIVIENGHHPHFTLIDIQTPDRLGLLYDLLRALGEADINIELSRITTEMEVAMDSFYVTCKDGKKLTDPVLIKRLQRLLQRAAVRSPA